jgi:hypothetical protein
MTDPQKPKNRFVGPERVEYVFRQDKQQWEARYPAFVKREQQRVLQRWAGYDALDRVLAWSQKPDIDRNAVDDT